MTLVLIIVATFLSTYMGGLFALRLKDRLHLILGFSAGAVIGVALFDLLPEALELAGSSYKAGTILAFTAIGFALYLVLDRFIFFHTHDDHGNHPQKGNFGAGSLSFHSFLDGMGIGLAFQVSPLVGAVVAAAVLAHDFSDGINTVSQVLKNGGTRRKALNWLFVDAIAPALGVLSTSFFTIPNDRLGILLALFAGFFLYIGATGLIPESHHEHPMRLTTLMTLLGMASLYFIITLAGV